MMKKKLLKAALLGVFCFTTPTVADCHDSPCCPESCWDSCWDPCCDWCGDFEIGGEALYWRPLYCQWDFATQSDGGTGLVNVFSIKNHYDWGFRVFGSWTCDDFYVALSYLYYRSTDAKGLAVAFDSTSQFQVNDVSSFKADASNRYDHQNVNLRVGVVDRDPCKDIELEGWGLLRWVDIENRREVRALQSSQPGGVAAINRFRQKAEFWGVGLGLGGGAHYDLVCGLGFFGESSVMAIIGERRLPSQRTLEVNQPEEVVSWVYRNETCVVPGLDLRVGLDYTWCCDCFSITGLIGYELNYYWNALILGELAPGAGFPDSTEVTLPRSCRDIGFAGLVLGFSIGF